MVLKILHLPHALDKNVSLLKISLDVWYIVYTTGYRRPHIVKLLVREAIFLLRESDKAPKLSSKTIVPSL